ncbi:hypothetical protein CFK37_03600 [Virgibacillus phasianinus]|uniref:Uncharacterized protein n=1 Tax=Virgibacillus phasianinus TaxID=2017483 RepID=A0A220U093_9BACI|nr:hypothetical protein CFK37_03600 [Virgibacillus phasianinus]
MYTKSSLKLPLYFIFGYIFLFFVASYVTSLILGADFGTMILFTILVIVYWFIAHALMGLFKKNHDLKAILLKVSLSILVIAIVSIIQQVLFINLSVTISVLFFPISLVLLWVLYIVYFNVRS